MACLIKWGRKSWRPWLISLMLEIISKAFSEHAKNITFAERQELTRRLGTWVYYLFRSPCYEKFVKPPATFILNKSQNIPILNNVFVNVLEYLMALQRYYFYTSN